MDYYSFTPAFELFPGAQHVEWSASQDGSLPALVLQHADDQRELWGSALSAAHCSGFQLNVVARCMKKGLFGIGKGKAGAAHRDD
ncbi:hypothetical protein KDX04_06620 [Burkholderia cenocepacia]|uniref:hypothetical protein n=1 Tax=Burkholderia cenocepacia TaxID=95486 RepID=UPI001B927A0A|nr:hypothetical protein [Burkholderia cenocepacia]MBR7985493.1 hypothetical protein [Burkholderia cenocepacia]